MSLNIIEDIECEEEQHGPLNAPHEFVRAIILTWLRLRNVSIDWEDWKTNGTIECSFRDQNMVLGIGKFKMGSTMVSFTWLEKHFGRCLVLPRQYTRDLFNVWKQRGRSTEDFDELCCELNEIDYQLGVTFYKSILHRIIISRK